MYALDAEWQRRFPKMVGALACQRCAVNTNQWKCENPDGTHVPGHIPAEHGEPQRDFDSWCHIPAEGTHRAMVVRFPWSGLRQGAEQYLRRLAHRPGVDAEVAQRLQQVLAEWAARADAGAVRR